MKQLKQDSVLFQCFFVDYPFYYTKQSYLHENLESFYFELKVYR